MASSPIARHEERRISAEQPQPTAAHRTITTARRPDHICLSALVWSRSTQFTAHPSCELVRGPPKRGHFPAILAVFLCAACMLAYRFLHMKWWAAVPVVAIPSQKALLICPYVSSGKLSVLAPRCSRALLHNLQLTSDRCLISASHLATGMIPAIAIISRLLCLPGTRGSF